MAGTNFTSDDGAGSDPEPLRVDIGFALTADVITGAGLGAAPRSLSFFAESTCPSLHVARRADFIEYFLETSRASLHTIVHGVHLSFADGLRTEVEALIAVLGERAVNILSVAPIETTIARPVECNLPEEAASWSEAVRRRARAAIATACAPEAEFVRGGSATALPGESSAGAASTAQPDGPAPVLPRVRRSGRTKATLVATAERSGSGGPAPAVAGAVEGGDSQALRQELQVSRDEVARLQEANQTALDQVAALQAEVQRGTDQVAQLQQADQRQSAEILELQRQLSEGNNERETLRHELLDTRTVAASAASDLAIAHSESSALRAELAAATDSGELQQTVGRLAAAREDTRRMEATLIQQRHRAGLNALEVSRLEQQLGWAYAAVGEVSALIIPTQGVVDAMALELNVERSARKVAEEHLARLEKDLRAYQGRAQRHRQEVLDLQQAVHRAELASVEALARLAGRTSAAEALVVQSNLGVEAEVGALTSDVESLMAVNEGLQDELRFERAESDALRDQVIELAARLTVVRSQVTRLPRITPRLQAAPSDPSPRATAHPVGPVPSAEAPEQALKQEQSGSISR